MTAPRLSPDTLVTARAQAITPAPSKHDHGSDASREDATPGQFEGTVFRHVHAHARRHPAPRAARRPMNRLPPSTAHADDEQFETNESATLSTSARRLIERLDRRIVADHEDGDDDEPDDEQHGIEQRRSKARLRAQVVPPPEASPPEAGRTDAPRVAPNAGDALRQVAQRAVALIERLGATQGATSTRTVLLSDVAAWLEVQPPSAAQAAGLAAVRALLTDGTHATSRGTAGGQRAADLRCLLPVLLLNLQRPRTARQSSRAAAKLVVMTRRR